MLAPITSTRSVLGKDLFMVSMNRTCSCGTNPEPVPSYVDFKLSLDLSDSSCKTSLKKTNTETRTLISNSSFTNYLTVLWICGQLVLN